MATAAAAAAATLAQERLRYAVACSAGGATGAPEWRADSVFLGS